MTTASQLAARSWKNIVALSMLRKKPMASTAIPSPRSGVSRPITARSAATDRCCARPRRSPVSAAVNTTSAMNSSPRSIFSTAATSSRTSWSAPGPTQFMPTAFKRYAVDFDRDGRRDVVDSMPDLIASTANNLKMVGWRSGETWGYEVVIPANFDFRLADHRREMTIADWQRQGIVRPGGKPFPHPNSSAFLLVPAGVQGPGFLMLPNFRVIMRYNPAEAYALAIGNLSDRLRGGGTFAQGWPRSERVLTREERLELQQLLERRGFDVGEPDGRLGAKTRAALRDFQARIGRVPDGFASASLLQRLRSR